MPWTMTRLEASARMLTRNRSRTRENEEFEVLQACDRQGCSQLSSRRRFPPSLAGKEADRLDGGILHALDRGQAVLAEKLPAAVRSVTFQPDDQRLSDLH